MAIHIMPENSLNLGHVKIIVKRHLQAFWQNFENGKCKNLVSGPLKIFFSKNSQILHTNSPWVCVIKVCSNGGFTYIISELKAKDNLNIANRMQIFENLLLQNFSTKYLDIAHR